MHCKNDINRLDCIFNVHSPHPYKYIFIDLSMTTSIRILIHSRDYTSWTFHDPDTNTELSPVGPLETFVPLEHRLFSKDVFTLTPTISILHSPVRTSHSHAGVLQLRSNKTFGRACRTKSNSKGRLLYKCIPDDKRLPVFLIPYEPPAHFSKVQVNMYVVFKFNQWTDKHPQGILEETLGTVDSVDAFYEYQLYCKSLHTSITAMTQAARTALHRCSKSEYVDQIVKSSQYQFRDLTGEYIFTIDPKHSIDFDDGFSLSPHPTIESKRILRVYIANVYVWLDALDLWNSFSRRVATIYLPDRRRPMLPTILSESLCSLQSGQERFAFVMEIVMDCCPETGTVVEETPQFYNARICVGRNYRYQEPELLADPHYNELWSITSALDPAVDHSQDVVSFWMVRMNCYCGRSLAAQQQGIFRSAVDSHVQTIEEPDMYPSTLSADAERIIRTWSTVKGQYVVYTERDADTLMHHAMLNIKTYIHCTSPIRRLVDLLNQMLFCRHCMGIPLSSNATEFLGTWINELDYINTTMRSIRKVQTDCELMHRCTTDPTLMQTLHSGVVFDRVDNKNNGMYTYMVYLEEWKMLSRVHSREKIENYTPCQCKIFLFESECQTKRKIRVQIVNSTPQFSRIRTKVRARTRDNF